MVDTVWFVLAIVVVAIAAVMIATRRIDWYALTSARSTPATAS